MTDCVEFYWRPGCPFCIALRRRLRGSGLPVRIPVIEMVEIGAGGGSLCQVNPLGLITVGPDSAGSEPGPACYHRGGSRATVTDANLLLGRMDPAALGRALGRLGRNPLLLSTLAGLGCAAFGVERFPLPLDLPLKILGDTASGLALLSLGATLEFRSLGPAVRATLPDSAMKLLVHPAAAWLCLLPFSLPRELLAATVLVSAMPHAVNCFIVAQEMDLDAPYAADSVLASTLLSALTFPLWLWVLGLG